MKLFKKLSTGFLLTLLIGCSGSKTYRGLWKATDKTGQKFEISFEAKSFTITDNDGKTVQFDYTQNSVAIENSVETYGIQLKDGRAYQIYFPNSNNENIGLIKDGNGSPLYTISRTGYLYYDDIYKLK
jgi:hypothetical protein